MAVGVGERRGQGDGRGARSPASERGRAAGTGDPQPSGGRGVREEEGERSFLPVDGRTIPLLRNRLGSP